MAPYYMLEEGDFLYYYIASVGIVAVMAICLGFCFGSCIFVGGGTAALKAVEEGLKNLESYTGVKTGANANADDGFQRHGENGDGEERKQNA